MHHVEHRAGAKGDLRARSNTGLPEERRRLIADQRRESWRARERACDAKRAHGVHEPREGNLVDAERAQRRLVPSIETCTSTSPLTLAFEWSET